MHRHRAASRLTSWLFVAALLLKSAVPMLASAAAGLQGKAMAEVCDVYGVDTSGLRAVPAGVGAHHDGHTARAPHAEHLEHVRHAHGAGSMPADAPTPVHGPASRVGHGGEHCALSALAFALASDAPGILAAPPATALTRVGPASAAPAVDPVARWTAQLQHGPPASA